MKRLFFIKLIFSLACFLYSQHIYGQFCTYKYRGDNCKSFLVTEFTFSQPIALTKGTLHRKLDFATNLGLMHDVHERLGIGAHFFTNIYLNGGWHSQYGLRPRVSFYVKPDWQLDFSPGVILADSSYPDGFGGYSIETNLHWKDHVGFSARLDLLAYNDIEDSNDVVLNLGVQTDGIKGGLLVAIGALGSAVGVILSRI